MQRFEWQKKRDLRMMDELDDGVEVLADSGEIKAAVPVVCEYRCGECEQWADAVRAHTWTTCGKSTSFQRCRSGDDCGGRGR